MGTDVKLSSEFTIIYGGEVIAYCTDFTLEKNKEIVDITKLGDTWKNKKVDMKDFNISFNGMVTRGDTITASLWLAATAYSAGHYVVLAGKAWEAQGSTTGDNPTTDDGTNWIETSAYAAGTTYAAGDMVYITSVANENRVYISLQGSNVGNDPLTETAYWERLETNYESLLKELANNDTVVKCTIKPTSTSETYYHGDGVLNSLSASFGVGDKATFSGGFAGSGALTAPTGTAYGSTYQDVYDAMTNKPSSSIANEQNTLVEALITAGVWSKLDLFYLFAQYSNSDGEAGINWVNPGTFDCTEVSSPLWTSLEGFTADGVGDDYLNTNWAPTTNGINFAQNDASIGSYVRNNYQENGGYLFGWEGTAIGECCITPRSLTDKQEAKINTTSFGASPTSTDCRGLNIVTRNLSTTEYQYLNKSQLSSIAKGSVTLGSLNCYILVRNAQGVGSQGVGEYQQSMFFAGAHLSQSEIEDFVDAIEAYMDSNGKGVIT